ncbi:hypothetical protein ACM77K_03630 [Pseudomonas aeruginosa]
MKREAEQVVSPAPAEPLPAQEPTLASSGQEPTPTEPESAPEQQQAEENTQALDTVLPIDKDIEYD